jgi:glutaredoxin-like YruB-family protein
MKIIIYSTPVCPYCVTLKNFLKEKGFEFEDVDVSLSEEGRKALVEKSGQMGVPVIDIDGEITVGFDKARISQLLGIDK